MKEIDQILLDLKRKIFKPVYFLSGAEAYYIDQVSDYIEEHALEEEDKGFNQTVVYGKDVDLIQVVNLANQFPMTGAYTVVIVKEAQDMRELSKKTQEKEGGEAKEKKENAPGVTMLINYLKNPQKSTILVFCYKYGTIDKRSALAKSITKETVYIETKQLYDNQLPQWITTYVTDKGYKINPRAAAMLAELLGNDLPKVAGELNKLFIAREASQEITLEQVQDNIGVSRDFNVFELQKALGTRDILKANQIINHFAANEKENPMPAVLAVLHGYFVKILKYHFLQDKSKFAAAAALGVNPYFVEDYVRAASTFSVPRLKMVFRILRDVDLRSKGIDNYSIGNGELMKEAVFKMLH
jgi:DNA polymerase-3 subunit delta